MPGCQTQPRKIPTFTTVAGAAPCRLAPAIRALPPRPRSRAPRHRSALSALLHPARRPLATPRDTPQQQRASPSRPLRRRRSWLGGHGPPSSAPVACRSSRPSQSSRPRPLAVTLSWRPATARRVRCWAGRAMGASYRLAAARAVFSQHRVLCHRPRRRHYRRSAPPACPIIALQLATRNDWDNRLG